MLTLAIETSCDETSAAVVEDGRLVRSNAIASQIALHAAYGGVVPEIASRQHIRAITWIVKAALRDAEIPLDRIDAMAATRGPGLAGALLVGANFARGLALARAVPFVPVNHLEGHIYSVWLAKHLPLPLKPRLPMMALIVSGGHTDLVLVREYGVYELLGRTRDDAVGEAFDKVARVLGLGYPGGPAIQRAATEASAPIQLPRAWLPGTFDFSFSGLKTAVLHTVVEMVHGRDSLLLRGTPLPKIDVAEQLSRDQIANVAAGFQASVIDVLVAKTKAAFESTGVASVGVVGGVSANGPLRERMRETFGETLLMPPVEFSTDNAAMIGAASYFALHSPDADIDPSLQLAASGQ
jgi:N6-L-threonylcarbamoyladenine synthase